tara:strand:- start:13 stop:1020 length:1008 start_codon:yes stop_codon:yes gene_type:complete
MNTLRKKNLLSLVGNTPLIRLNYLSDITRCEILGKAEFLNPGGSVKDRAALAIINDAIFSGTLKPGGTIIEGTAGNTGISLTLLGNALGYKTIIVMPDTQSEEKRRLLKILGAKLELVPAAPYRNPNNYVRYSEQLSIKLSKDNPSKSVFWANQFDNVANLNTHFNTTGPELWQQTNGDIDGFICAVGSGGTLAGVAKYLKTKNSDIKIGLSDPFGSALHNFFEKNEMKSDGNSVTEGIGQGRITKNLEGFVPDYSFKISDHQAILEIQNTLRSEGLYLGGSSGINIYGAFLLAKKLGPGHTICTILCDSGQRYESKIWNQKFLQNKNLPIPDWL